MTFKRNIDVFFKKITVCVITLTINSCLSYEPVRFSRTINISNYDNEKTEKADHPGTDFSNYYSSSADDKKGYIADNKKNETRFYSKRYFAEVNSFQPLSKINNRGVEYALAGKFIEAKFIFEEALKEDSKFAPACNNLGIIFELFNRKDDAFRMYTNACIIDPENQYYRNNFLCFQELR